MSNGPDKIRLSHVLLSWSGAKPCTHTRDLVFALAEAKLLIGELLSGKMTWTQAVKGHSACLETPFGTGDLGWREIHEITPELWRAGVVTKIGEIFPEPVQTPYGIHIVFRTG